eukprot:TRINITY_DN17037_c0_g2_i1.p1 TRINITY_DN17037_c0_g2~~TRINITY_DN17037_c0_g2_i1.p1  ORF type:complete len:879 (+),score=226.26 TRINITY_DN17037_c0_g2_i1:137-2638(+)
MAGSRSSGAALLLPQSVAVAPVRHCGASLPPGDLGVGSAPGLGGGHGGGASGAGAAAAGAAVGSSAATVEEHGLDVARLLRGLQRGSVPGADASVVFLCQKFSLLLERLQRAEQGHAAGWERCGFLEAEVRSEEAAAERERSEHEAAAAKASGECGALRASLSKAQQELARMEAELQRAQAEREDLARRRASLDEQCAGERARLAEANNRIRQLQMSRPTGADELRQLQERFETLSARYAATAAELKGTLERTARDDARAAELKAEASEEDEARARFSDNAASQREDLRVALSELALLRERFAEVQASVQCCGAELARRTEGKQALRRELQRREVWLATNVPKVENLRRVERGLERVLADIAEARSQLQVEEAAELQAIAANGVVEASLEDSEARLAERAQRLAEVERESALISSEEAAAEDERQQLEASMDQLRHDQVASGGLCQNLEGETRLLLAETEALKRERDGFLASRSEMQQRLTLVGPALREARSHLRHLEDRIAATQGAGAQEQQLNGRYEREIVGCQDKLSVLRDENVQLSEHCTEFEAELVNAAARRNSDHLAGVSCTNLSGSRYLRSVELGGQPSSLALSSAPTAQGAAGSPLRSSREFLPCQTAATSRLHHSMTSLRSGHGGGAGAGPGLCGRSLSPQRRATSAPSSRGRGGAAGEAPAVPAPSWAYEDLSGRPCLTNGGCTATGVGVTPPPCSVRSPQGGYGAASLSESGAEELPDAGVDDFPDAPAAGAMNHVDRLCEVDGGASDSGSGVPTEETPATHGGGQTSCSGAGERKASLTHRAPAMACGMGSSGPGLAPQHLRYLQSYVQREQQRLDPSALA